MRISIQHKSQPSPLKPAATMDAVERQGHIHSEHRLSALALCPRPETTRNQSTCCVKKVQGQEGPVQAAPQVGDVPAPRSKSCGQGVAAHAGSGAGGLWPLSAQEEHVSARLHPLSAQYVSPGNQVFVAAPITCNCAYMAYAELEAHVCSAVKP